MKKIVKILLVGGLFVFLGVIPLLWLRKPGYMINGVDTNFPLDPLSWFLQRLYVWNPTINGGSDWSSSVSAIFFHGLQAFFYWSGFSLINTEKITLIFWLLFLGFSIYYLFSTIQEIYFKGINGLNLYLARITAVIFYIFNLYQMDIWKNVKVANLMVLIAAPLALAIFMKLLYKKLSFPLAIFFLAILMVICAGVGLNPAYFLTVVFVLVTWLLWYFLMQKIYKRADRKQQIIYALGGLLSIVVVSSFWLIPLAANMLGITGQKVVSLKDLGAQDWLIGLSKNTSILAVLRLLGAWDWYENGFGNIPYVSFATTYFYHPYFIFYSILIPFFASLGFYVYRKHYIVYYFSFLMVIGIIFGAGAHQPFGSLYLFFTDYLPFFSFFRSPWYIFTSFTILGYAVLIGLLVQEFVHHYHKKAVFLAVIILIGNFIYTFPMVRGDIFRPYQTIGTYFVKFPQYVYDFGNFITLHPQQGNILVTPQVPAENYSWGYSGVTPLISLLSNASVIFPQYGQDNIGTLPLMSQQLEKELQANDPNGLKNVLGILGISAVLNRKDLFDRKPVPDNNFSSDVFDISKEKSFGEWTLYSVKPDFIKPTFWIPDQKVMVDGDVKKYPAISSLATFDPNAEAVFTSGIGANQRQLPTQSYNTLYIVPNCLFCEGYTGGSFPLPYVRFLPGSIFYNAIEWKEERDAKAYPGIAQVDYKLHLGDKRLEETRQLIVRNEQRKDLFSTALKRFDSEIQQAIQITEQAEKNGQDTIVTWKTTSEHLSSYTRTLHDFSLRNLPGPIFEIVDHELILVELYKQQIKSHLWYPKDATEKIFTFSIPYQATYQLLYRQNNAINDFYQKDPSLFSDIFIDGVKASSAANTKNGEWLEKGEYLLNPGLHKMEIKTPQLTNLVDIPDTKIVSITAKDELETYRIPLKKMMPHYTYLLSLQYRIIRGREPRVVIDYAGGKDIKELNTKVLDYAKDWQEYTQFLDSENPITNGQLVLAAQPDGSNVGTQVEFRNITVYAKQAPEIVWQLENKSSTQTNKPVLIPKQLSPIAYTVDVKNAHTPFTLIFNQSFQKGWQASIDGKKIDSTKHFLVNGYANAWDIDKTGDYTIKVEYTPQRLFVVGIVITVILIIISAVTYLVTKEKYRL